MGQYMKQKWITVVVGSLLMVIEAMAQMPRETTSVVIKQKLPPPIPVKVDIIKLAPTEDAPRLGIFPGKDTPDEYIDLELSPYVVQEEIHQPYIQGMPVSNPKAIVVVNNQTYIKIVKTYQFVRYRLCELKRDEYGFNVWLDYQKPNVKCQNMFGGAFVYFDESMRRRLDDDNQAHLELIGFYEVLPFLVGAYAFKAMYTSIESAYQIVGMGSHLIATGMAIGYSDAAYTLTKSAIKITDENMESSPLRGFSKRYQAIMKNDTKLEVLTGQSGLYSTYGKYFLPPYVGDVRQFKQKLEDLMFDNDGRTLDYAVSVNNLSCLSMYPTSGGITKVCLPGDAPVHKTVSYDPGNFSESYMGSQFGINRTLFMMKLFDELGWFKKK